MLNRLKPGLDKGHVMHFKNELQPWSACIRFLLLHLFGTDWCLYITKFVLIFKWILCVNICVMYFI